MSTAHPLLVAWCGRGGGGAGDSQRGGEGRERGGTERGRPLPSAAAPIDVLLALG